MPKLNPSTAEDHVEADGFAGHYRTLGDLTIGFESYSQDDDPAPLFAGLPDDCCQARHWGVVLEGTLVFNYRDGTQDVIEAGEAYYAPPGHLPIFKAGTRVVEFSPADELAKTMEVVMANVAAMQSG
ncbi:MAG: cupin domain-containing protein [Acidimicrobiia bacterium]